MIEFDNEIKKIKKMTKINKHEANILLEMQNTIYQDMPLIRLIEKNYVERRLSPEQVAYALYQLVMEGKIQLSDDAMAYMDFDRLIIAHYESLHRNNNSVG